MCAYFIEFQLSLIGIFFTDVKSQKGRQVTTSQVVRLEYFISRFQYSNRN